MRQDKKAKKLELRLLKALRRDSSMSISRIARKLKEPVTTVFEAERKLRSLGVVKRYYSALDFEKAGFAIRALFLMNVEDGKLEEAAKALMRDRSVNNLQVLEGSCNLLAEAVFSSMGQFFSFSGKLCRIGEKKVYLILETPKTEAAAVF